MNSNKNAIDLFKFIAALLVIAIHNPVCGFDVHTGTGHIVNIFVSSYIARLAVPFFFMTTAYFLFSKHVDSLRAGSVKTIGKLFRLYVIWTLIYLPFILWNIFKANEPLHETLVFVKDFFLVGSFCHLWYLTAALFAIAAVAFLLKRNVSITKILTVSLILYVIGLFDDSWYGVVPESVRPLLNIYNHIFATTRNGLFDGLPFVALGAWLAIRKPAIKRPFTGFAISMLLLMAEVYFVSLTGICRDNNMYLFLPASTYFLFYMALHLELPGSRIYPAMRTMSSLLYFIHMLAGTVVSIGIRILGIGVHPACYYLMVVALSMASAYIIMRMARCKHLGWIRSLYS